MKKDIFWFKKHIAPALQGFEIEYSFHGQGDFGNLNRVEIEGRGKGGNVDFWEKGWLEIHLFDYQTNEELIHILLEPNQTLDKDKYLKTFKTLLK